MVNLDATTPQLKVVQSVVESYSSRDLENSASIFSKDFKFQSYPKTTYHVEETKAEHFKKYGGVFPSYAKVENIFHEVIEAPGKVVLHMTAVWTTVDGLAINYDTLLIFSFVEEDGELKVLGIKDFADPVQRNALHNEAARAQSKGPVAA